MAFESFNQIMKRAAERTNYRDLIVSIAEYWSMKSALSIKAGKTTAWAADTVCVSSATSTGIPAYLNKPSQPSV